MKHESYRDLTEAGDLLLLLETLANELALAEARGRKPVVPWDGILVTLRNTRKKIVTANQNLAKTIYERELKASDAPVKTELVKPEEEQPQKRRETKNISSLASRIKRVSTIKQAAN